MNKQHSQHQRDVLDELLALRERREVHAVATVIETQGSVSAKTGSKAVIDAQGKILCGWVGGGCAESAISQTALACMASGEPDIVYIDMNDEVLGVGMPCGGSMRVFIEPMLPEPILWILGANRLAEHLCAMGAQVGLEVNVIGAELEPERFPAASRLIADDPGYNELKPGVRDYVVIATLHKGDYRSAQKALSSPVPYLGLIASRKRAGLVIDFLREQGVSEADIARVHSPAGLDIGARTPAEIALSTIAEIVRLRRLGVDASIDSKRARSGA